LLQGYTEQQVRQTLQQNGYPQSLIDATFAGLGSTTERAPQQAAKTTASQQLSSYLKTYLAQGYQVEQLKPYLLQQGYTERDVDDALAATTGVVRHEVHLPFATIAKVAFLILLIGAVVVGILWLKGGTDDGPIVPPITKNTRLLDLKVTLEKSSIPQGETLDVQIDAFNMGKGTFDVKFTTQLLDRQRAPVLTEEETRAITTSVSFNQRLIVPDDVAPGQYAVKVTAEYGGETAATTSKTLTITKGTNSGTGPPEEDIPPDGPPEIIIITDNGFDSVIEEATAAARRGDSPEAEQQCLAIENQVAHDQCLSMITLNDQQSGHCEEIISDEERDTCYMPFVLSNGQYELCELLRSQERKDLCFNLQRINNIPGPSTEPTTGPNIDDFV